MSGENKSEIANQIAERLPRMLATAPTARHMATQYASAIKKEAIVSNSMSYLAMRASLAFLSHAPLDI
jgi:hypothetical protein